MPYFIIPHHGVQRLLNLAHGLKEKTVTPDSEILKVRLCSSVAMTPSMTINQCPEITSAGGYISDALAGGMKLLPSQAVITPVSLDGSTPLDGLGVQVPVSVSWPTVDFVFTGESDNINGFAASYSDGTLAFACIFNTLYISPGDINNIPDPYRSGTGGGNLALDIKVMLPSLAVQL